jgi:hypothetical protein
VHKKTYERRNIRTYTYVNNAWAVETSLAMDYKCFLTYNCWRRLDPDGLITTLASKVLAADQAN